MYIYRRSNCCCFFSLLGPLWVISQPCLSRSCVVSCHVLRNCLWTNKMMTTMMNDFMHVVHRLTVCAELFDDHVRRSPATRLHRELAVEQRTTTAAMRTRPRALRRRPPQRRAASSRRTTKWRPAAHGATRRPVSQSMQSDWQSERDGESASSEGGSRHSERVSGGGERARRRENVNNGGGTR